jgi:hypothetical protein
MATTVWGVVEEGRVVPSSPLAEGAHVEIRIADPLTDVAEDLQAEFEACDRAGAKALDLVERLAREGEADAARSGACASPSRLGMRRRVTGRL